MEFDAVLIPPRRAAMVAAGFWHDRTINDELDACLAECPDKSALTVVQLDQGQTSHFTYAELARMADRVAVGLARLGVGRSDVVACQLPNSWQYTVTCLACSRIGAVINPLVHIFRERELGFMLKHGGAKVILVPKTFRGFDFEAMLTGLQPSLPDLQQVIVVGGQGGNSFEALLSGPAWECEADAHDILSRSRPGPDDIIQLMYTSGTTGESKGVMHTANTLLSNVIPFAERLRLNADDVVYMTSPMAHQTGFMFGLLLPLVLRARAVVQDIWDPQQGVALMRSHHVSFTMASTPFLSDLTREVEDAGVGVPSLRVFVCGGTPIPSPLVERAHQVLGATIVSTWGMTENGAATLTRLEDANEMSSKADGCPLPGVEVKVVDDGGAALPPGRIGTLLVRACSNFGGYLKRPQLNAMDEEGWFNTGDLAHLDERDYVRITGRSKDVIIRGGENIPVVEIEALLYRHPAIDKVAIVAYPDERLGERACAVVVPVAGHHITLFDVVEFLHAQKVARQYLPERLIVCDDLPMTPAGKVQKFKLREMLRDSAFPPQAPS